MSRNAVVSVLAALSAGLLLAASLGAYRVFSYLAAALIAGVVAAGAIEHGDTETDLAPYGRIAAGLAGLFAVGLSGIWLLWNPTVTEYTYVLGLPQSTLIYVVFIWLLPLAGAFYYSMVFPEVGSEEIVEDVLSTATAVQRREHLPLSLRTDDADADDPTASAGEPRSEGGGQS